MRNILFIGGAGFIGANVVRCILSSAHDYCIHIMEPAFANIGRLAGVNVKVHRGDLENFDLLQSIISTNKIETIVHLVSTLIPSSSYEDYKQEFQNVVFPTVRLIQYCSTQGIEFIYFSSGGTVYGNRVTQKPFDESEQMAPISYYGLTKQIVENNILFEHRTSQLRYLIVRPSNPYGHGQALNGKQGLIAVAIGHILAGEKISIWGDGSSVRDYIYIDDLANIIWQLIEKRVMNVTLNIGSGVGYSINDILECLRAIVEENIRFEYQKARSVDVTSMILNITELRKYVDVHITPLEKGIANFYHQAKAGKK